MKKLFLFSFILVTLIGFGVLFKKYYSPTQLPPKQKQNHEQVSVVTLKIDYGNGEVVSFNQEVEDNTTAFSVLEKATKENDIKMETQQYDFGVFVKSINSFESGADLSWIYFVNGKSGGVAADQKTLNPDDLVEWKYMTPSE